VSVCGVSVSNSGVVDNARVAGVLHAQLLARYYDAAAAEREPDAYAQCAASLARVPPAHLAALIRAYAQRPPLTADALRRLRARTLVWSARNTYYQEDALDLIAQLPPADTAFMQVSVPPRSCVCICPRIIVCMCA